MKFALALSLLLPTLAQAAPSERACFRKAEAAVEREATPGYYDQDGFQTVSCELASNRKAMICEVAAYKGEGAASDTYRVVLNATCAKVFRVELTGEE